MKYHKWMAIILILSLAFNIKASFDISSMKNEISNLKNTVFSTNDSVRNSVSTSIWQIEEALKKETSLVSSFQYDFIELKDKRVDYLLTLKPRIFKKEEKIFFMVKSDKEEAKLIPAETKDDITFTAIANVSVFEGADIDLVIESGDIKKTEVLDRLYPAVEKFTADIQANPIGGLLKYIKDKGYLFMTYDFGLHYWSPHDGSVILQDINLNIEVNGKIVDKVPMPKESKGAYDYYLSLKEYKIPSKIGDTIYAYITAGDERGFNYKISLESWAIGPDGNINYNPDVFNPGNLVEIY